MLKKIIFKRIQKKINSLKPSVSISLHKEMPSPSLQAVSQLAKIVVEVNKYEKELLEKPDSFFREVTAEYKNKIKEQTNGLEGEDFKVAADKLLDEMLPFYFACVREAARRTLAMRHFDVQIVGGIVLHKNKIAEMTTGEGKTLVATLAASLNALAAGGVHVVTVNDYLAKRDRDWMCAIYNFLGLSCGVIQQNMNKEERKAGYSCDITYGTNNEFGFDYLRDNMVSDYEDKVQKRHFYAIVDEVDSILVDEARTPLIISGPSEVSVEKYYRAERVVRQINIKKIIQSFVEKDKTVTIKHLDGSEAKMLPEELEKKYDAIVEEKTHNAYLTHQGESKCENLLGVSSLEESPDKFSAPWIHYINQSLRAHELFKVDKEYIVKDGKVLIVDDFTGRLMPGRRWSDGLHQAVEAKENLRIQEESQTLATITLQNYFRMYSKLSGMTGTAYTEANEFKHIYGLDVMVLPTNKPLQRSNHVDRIYKTKKGKFFAVIDEIVEMNKKERPVLVGTTSIQDSEELSFLLGKKGVKHNVLNAKYHEREAHIVAQAGSLSQVTIATNMAGRGTDIILGGNLDYYVKDILAQNNILADDEKYLPAYQNLVAKHKDKFIAAQKKVIELGGLHIIGTQRHEARRIDNQLRGRSGRQGDPGSSRFYVSLEDDLMRLFGSDKIYMLMERFGFPEDQPIEHPLINHSLAIAQKKVEGHNFEIRKQLLQYDNIMNKQREIIYQQRSNVLESESIKDEILDMISTVIEANVPVFFAEERNILGLIHWLKNTFSLEVSADSFDDFGVDQIVKEVKTRVLGLYDLRETESSIYDLRQTEKMAALWVVDSKWKEHLLIMDSLKEGIHLRGYAQTDPLVEYQKESYYAFQDMVSSIKEDIVATVFKTRVAKSNEVQRVFDEAVQIESHNQYSALNTASQAAAQDPVSKTNKSVDKKQKVGRNDPCSCGSGKKYKKCCGQ
ncbi:MAG: preprotein translocase subunit SecA [Candidatus Omnitrophica bacterium]|nr:preprotein translocase subunit SecA [Candidatus Omnitrophota bacterium]